MEVHTKVASIIEYACNVGNMYAYEVAYLHMQ